MLKQLQLHFKKILLLSFLFTGLSSLSQATENFSNIPGSISGYATRTWTGTDGVQWSATSARTDQSINGKAICTNNSGTVSSPVYSGGMGTLQFNYVRAFTGTGERLIQVWVNGQQVGSTITVSPNSNSVVSYSGDINIAGDVELELRTSGAQIKIDNVQWTAYSGTEPTITATPNVLTGLSYEEGEGPSTASAFSLSAINLENAPDTIIINESADFEVSSESATAGFGATATVEYSSDELAETTVWLRLKAGRIQGDYNNQSITISGGGAASAVTVSGSVVPPVPDNDLCENAEELTINGDIVQGNLEGSTFTELANGGDDNDVWYTFVAGCTGSYTVTVNNFSGDTDVYLFADSCPSDNIDSISSASTASAEEVITVDLTAGTTYIIRVVAWNVDAENTFDIKLTSDSFTPVVSFQPASEVSTSSALIAGTIMSEGCSAVTEYGVEYSTIADFVSGTSTVIMADNLAGSDFSILLDELELNITYYYRTYAVNDEGIGYSAQSAFTTDAVGTPVAITATNITGAAFTANWTAATAADSYRLDVSESEDFGTFITGTTTTETFNDMPTNNSGYSTRVWTGNNGIDWTATNSRTDQTINGRAITFESNSNASLESAVITGGVTQITFNAQRAFGGNTGVLTVKILSGTDFSTVITVGTHTYNANVSTFDSGVISGITGDFKIRIETDGAERAIIDDLSFIGTDIIDPDYVDGYENLTVTGTSIDVTGLEQATTYYYRVRAVAGDNTSENSNVISVETGIVNIWNGTEWTLGTAPTIDDEAIIEGDYNTADEGEFEASLLTVNSGTFTIAEGTSITVDGAVINNGDATDFVIENNANLIQVSDANNTGDVYVIKNGSPLFRLDYTIWSSPVAAQNLADFSPNTMEERFYTYDTAADVYSSIDPAANNFETGAGYLIRMPNSYPNSGDTSGYNDGETAVSFEGVFTGIANNGTVNVPLSTAGEAYNMVGNPYPSPINIYDFYALNTGAIDEGSALYFWRKTNDPDESSYATITKLAYAENEAAGGDTGSTTFVGSPEEWVINPGQGFFVQAAAGVDLVFTNTMRRNVNNGQFFRTTDDESAMSRIWLDIAGTENGFSQSVIGYTDITTNEIDYGWDGKSISSGTISLYSLVDDTELSIQARSQFTIADVVPVGYRVQVAGSYTIKLSEMDGVFSGDQDVFIKDNVTATVHNLKDSDYTFTTSEGTFNNRLEVVYQNEALSNSNPVFTANNVIVYKSGNTIGIDAGNVQMSGVNVYDMRGSLLYSRTGVNATETTIDNLSAQQQVLIINISTNKGEVSKKIVF